MLKIWLNITAVLGKDSYGEVLQADCIIISAVWILNSEFGIAKSFLLIASPSYKYILK